jgi:hypothetical protein
MSLTASEVARQLRPQEFMSDEVSFSMEPFREMPCPLTLCFVLHLYTKSLHLLWDILQRRDNERFAHGHKPKRTRFVSSFFATRIIENLPDKADDYLRPQLLGDYDMVCGSVHSLLT